MDWVPTFSGTCETDGRHSLVAYDYLSYTEKLDVLSVGLRCLLRCSVSSLKLHGQGQAVGNVHACLTCKTEGTHTLPPYR